MIRRPKLDVVLPIAPKAKGRPRLSRKGVVFTPAATRKWEGQCAAILAQHSPPEPFEGPLIMDVLYVEPRPGYMRKKDRNGKLKHEPNLILKPNKPDLDNVWKSLKDSCGLARIYKDDCLVVAGFQMKCYAELDGEARIEVMISEAMEAPEVLWMATRHARGSQLH